MTQATTFIEKIVRRCEDGQSPDSIEVRPTFDGGLSLLVDYGRDTFSVRLDTFGEDVTNRDALDSETLDGEPSILVGMLSGTHRTDAVTDVRIIVLYDGFVREYDDGITPDELFARYYNLGEDYINDTQQPAWHLNYTDERERYLLLE